MNVKLINPPTFRDALTQVLYNRGVKDIATYLKADMSCINEPQLLGQDCLTAGARMLMVHISANDPVLVVVDADCDGFTSSALLINYLHDCFPTFVEEHIDYCLHEGKQHGLADIMDMVGEYKLIILPDSSSNDYEYHKEL